MIEHEQTESAQYPSNSTNLFQVIRFPSPAHANERGPFNEPCDRDPWRIHTNGYSSHQESCSDGPMDIGCDHCQTVSKIVGDQKIEARKRYRRDCRLMNFRFMFEQFPYLEEICSGVQQGKDWDLA